MEEPLEDSNLITALNGQGGFNPYFDGRAFGSVSRELVGFIPSGFNPYFDGRAFGRILLVMAIASRSSFNPYFDGRAFGRLASLAIMPIILQFQSLFRWKSLWKSYKHTNPIGTIT